MEQPFSSWIASRVAPDAVQDKCSWLVAIGFFVAAFSKVNPTFQPGEGRMLRTHCQRAGPRLWD